MRRTCRSPQATHVRLIHTSDWHLGQTLRSHERGFEHQCFLDWLLDQLVERAVDVLLIAGDVYDTVNPSAQSQRQLYRFLAAAQRRLPGLQTVLIAGNHDSAGRLEAPQPLLEGLAVQVVGQVRRDPLGQIELDAMLLPLGPDPQRPEAWCLTVPYLRPADVPLLPDAADPYLAGVAELYRQLFELALMRRHANEPIIAMGHCHARGGKTSEDSERRLVIGGSEAIAVDSFPAGLAYVALGHLHLAQKVEGLEHIRYCGAPLPFSFSEARYPHQILQVDLACNQPARVETVRVPRFVELLRLPAEPAPLAEVLDQLAALDLPELPPERQPLVEVRVQLLQPEPDHPRQIRAVLEDKPVRLLRIDAHGERSDAADWETLTVADPDPAELKPEAVLREHYQSEYKAPLPDELAELLLELLRADAGDSA
jgi:DNA repair protein SbcD/Mre11